ncbi:MAG TPA: cytochrome c oxidase assembly protein [Gemmatirosa sp.]|nr:cytochrome c oxidase assembly protein [Gemmatirosa sp.]
MRALLLLHPVAQLGTAFTVHASTVLGIAALAVLYEWRARRAPVSGSPTAPQRAAFHAALLLLFLSLNGPVHDLSDTFLFSAHMIQHLVLELLVPPLLLVGTPGWMLRPLLRPRAVRAVAERVTRPAWCFAIFNLVLAGWHLPPAYNLALAHHPVHITQHLMFIAASVIMWWPLLGSLPELPRPSYPVQLLYCFLMTIPMSIVSIYIVYADRVLYPAYATAPRIFGISPLEDQRIGGLVMWIPGGLYFLLVMSVVFFRWSQRGGTDDVVGAQALEPVGT